MLLKSQRLSRDEGWYASLWHLQSTLGKNSRSCQKNGSFHETSLMPSNCRVGSSHEMLQKSRCFLGLGSQAEGHIAVSVKTQGPASKMSLHEQEEVAQFYNLSFSFLVFCKQPDLEKLFFGLRKQSTVFHKHTSPCINSLNEEFKKDLRLSSPLQLKVAGSQVSFAVQYENFPSLL